MTDNQQQFLQSVSDETSESQAVLVVTHQLMPGRSHLYCPICGSRIHIRLGGTGVVEMVCRRRGECQNSQHKTVVIFKT